MSRKLPSITLSTMIFATPLFATTVMKMDLPALVSTSDSIIKGRIESVEARYEERRVFTYVSVTVDDPLKGERKSTILIKQPGGTIGERTEWVAGMPRFKAGAQVILFLRNRQDGTFDVVGLNQGKYEIMDDYAVANVSGVSMMDPRTGLVSDAGFIQKNPVETFKAKIRELVR